MKKLWFVLMILLPIVFVSCVESNDHFAETVSAKEAISEENTAFLISVEDITKYSLIRSEDASANLISATSELYKRLREISTNIDFKDDYFRDDLPDYAMGEYEILIGATNRPESIEFIQTLRTKDYGYTLQNGKIIIAGATDEYTIKAVKKFQRDIANGDLSDGIFYSEDDNFFEAGSYPLDSLTIAGIPVQDFTIIYSEAGNCSERLCAESLSSAIADATGFILEPVSDHSNELVSTRIPSTSVSETIDISQYHHVILIGRTTQTIIYPTLADNESYIGMADTTVQLGGNNVTAIFNAVKVFTELFDPDEKNVAIELNGENIYRFDNSVLTAMSFNILCSKMDNDRINRVLQIIKNYLPDTFGVQEATPQWMRQLDKEFNEIYSYVGEGRDGGNSGEYSAIFYNKTKFSVIESGTKWLSDTPDKISKVPESSLNRIFTYALLRRLSDNMEIMVINTHFEHTSDEAREHQAEILKEFLLNYTDKYPIILTGDFNTTYGSTAFNTILESGMTDAMVLSDTSYIAPTFTNFGSANSIIDFIFVTEKNITVNNYRVCDEKIDGDFPSDHHPVLIEYIFLG